jgi:tetratricopeptide (TPR) repeat protein
VDSIGKKITVVKAVAESLGLKNVSAEQIRAEQLIEEYDFIVSRAVTRLKEFYGWVHRKAKKKSVHELDNGILYLKGGDLEEELIELKNVVSALGFTESLIIFHSLLSLKNLSFDKALKMYEEENLEMSYEFFNLAGEIDKSDSTIHYNAGFLANDLGRFEDAKRHFNYLFEIPGYNKTNAYYFMVQILSTEEKNPEGAFELVSKARKEYPDDKVLAEYEIQLLLQLNKMDQAMTQIKDALENDPNNVGLLLRSGYLKEQAGDLDGGLADYKKSVEIDPNFFEGNYYTGALLLEQATTELNTLNDLSDAEWEKQSPIVGKKADANYTESIKYFSKALEIKPDNTDIMIILYQVYSRLKKTAEMDAMNKKIAAILGANWQDN